MAKTLRSARHKRLIARLAEARRKRGLTQADVAAILGRPQSFIAKVENGERRLEVLEFADLAQALGEDAGRLLSEIGT